MEGKGKKKNKKKVLEPSQADNTKTQKANNEVNNKTLPTKEQNMLNKAVKFYEQNQHKQGLKICKQILSNNKCSGHTETLAFKGLMLQELGRNSEAEEAIRLGLKNDPRNLGCWKALAKLHREAKNLKDSIKCLRNCLKLSPGNLDILRNLSDLAIQTSDLEGYSKARFDILQLKPTQRAAWGGLAVSHHLLGDYEMALAVLDEFDASQSQVNRSLVGDMIQSVFNKKTDYNYEYSEILKYHFKVLVEAGRLENALKFLQANRDSITDKVFLLDEECELRMKMSPDKEQIVKVLLDLIQRNPYRTDYYEKFIQVSEMTKEEDILNFLSGEEEKHKSNSVPVLLSLKYAADDNFRSKFAELITKKLEKGILTAFTPLASLYTSQHKAETIGAVLGDLSKEKDDRPAVLLFYHAQHAYHRNQLAEANSIMDEVLTKASEHPEPEFHLFKGKLLHKSKKTSEAIEEVSKAFQLDPTDKYIGSKLAKYQLADNRVEDAVATMANFTKPGVKPVEYLEEIQDTPFILNLARAYSRLGKHEYTVKYCYIILDIFQRMEDDLIDFHQFSLTKLRLCAYHSTIKQIQSIRNHPDFVNAAMLGVEGLIQLYDKNSEAGTQNPNSKKGKKITQETGGRLDIGRIEQCDHLAETAEFIRHLDIVGPEYPRSHEVKAEVYVRRSKPLLVARSVSRLGKDADTKKFLLWIQRYLETEDLNENIVKVLQSFLEDRI